MLVEPLVEVAREELDHFRVVCGELEARAGVLGPQRRNPYAEALHARAAEYWNRPGSP